MELNAHYFFNLTAYAHKDLFIGDEFVWNAFAKIKTYLKTFQHTGIQTEIPQGVTLIHKEFISIGKGTTIEPGSFIKGPCVIGENCEIRHGAYIRGNVIIGNDCVIGHDTEVKNSILLDGAKAAHFAYLGDTILGNHVNLGAGTKCANLRLDEKEITLFFEGKKIKTGLRKFGAILGDHTQLGCNSVTNPGTLTGMGVHGYPCTNFGGFIPSNSLIKPLIEISITPQK